MSRIVKELVEGMVAGMAMAMVGMGAMVLRGQSAWRTVELMAAALQGPWVV